MTTGAGDALFGQDGTGGDIGPLPGFELPVVRLPIIGPDGEITGLDDFDRDLDAGPATTAPPAAAPAPAGSGAYPPPAGPTTERPAPGRTEAPAPIAHPAGATTAPAVGPPRGPVPPPIGGRGGTGQGRPPGAPQPVAQQPRYPVARPTVVDEPGILGLSRRSRSRWGSRLFTAFFVFVFAVILIQMIAALLAA